MLMRLAGDHRHLADGLARADVPGQLHRSSGVDAESAQRTGQDEVDLVGRFARPEELPAAWKSEIACLALGGL